MIDHDAKVVSHTRTIPAPAGDIFELLADPRRHHEIDGSDMVQAARVGGPERLSMGAKFGMDMKFGPIPYRITNEVVTFEEGREIAWRHFGHHVWRYELTPVDEHTTEVTERFEWGEARVPAMYPLAKYPQQHDGNIERTLERLAERFT